MKRTEERQRVSEWWPEGGRETVSCRNSGFFWSFERRGLQAGLRFRFYTSASLKRNRHRRMRRRSER